MVEISPKLNSYWNPKLDNVWNLFEKHCVLDICPKMTKYCQQVVRSW